MVFPDRLVLNPPIGCCPTTMETGHDVSHLTVEETGGCEIFGSLALEGPEGKRIQSCFFGIVKFMNRKLFFLYAQTILGFVFKDEFRAFDSNQVVTVEWRKHGVVPKGIVTKPLSHSEITVKASDVIAAARVEESRFSHDFGVYAVEITRRPSGERVSSRFHGCKV